METNNQKSKAYQLCKLVWGNHDNSSFIRINDSMRKAVELAIISGFEFFEDDFSDIFKNFRGVYWFGANINGIGYAEFFYRDACEYKNISACKSFEKFIGIKPFILKNDRVCVRSTMIDRENQKKLRVTGFNEVKNITLVCYDITDYQEKRKRSLVNYSNKEWLEVRKTLELL